MNLTNTQFSENFPCAQLHWILADTSGCIVVESMKDELHIYDNPVGVLTNNPPFPQQMFQLNNYQSLSPRQPENTFAPELSLQSYSRGMGALGLPGDLSSASRFAKVAFTKMNSRSGDSELESVSQFFHILGSVDQQRGCCEVAEKTNTKLPSTPPAATQQKASTTTLLTKNHQISAVNMNHENLDSSTLIRYPVLTETKDSFSEINLNQIKASS